MRRAIYCGEEDEDWHGAELLEGRLRLGIRDRGPYATATRRSRDAGGREAVSFNSDILISR